MFKSVIQSMAENNNNKKKQIQIQQKKEMGKLSVAADKPLKGRKGRESLTK